MISQIESSHAPYSSNWSIVQLMSIKICGIHKNAYFINNIVNSVLVNILYSSRQKTLDPSSNSWKLENAQIIQAKLIVQIMHGFTILWPHNTNYHSVIFSNISLKDIKILGFSLQFIFSQTIPKKLKLNCLAGGLWVIPMPI